MVKQKYAAKLDQAPVAPLGTVIGHQDKCVVGDTELEHLRQVRISFRYGVELLLRYTEGGRAPTE